jgi:hypothetical protein
MVFFFYMQPSILILNYGPSTRFSPTGPLHFFTPHQNGPVDLLVQSSRPSDAPPGDHLPLRKQPSHRSPASGRSQSEAPPMPRPFPSSIGTRVPPILKTVTIEAAQWPPPSCLPRPITSPPWPIKRHREHPKASPRRSLPPLSPLLAPRVLTPSFITVASALRCRDTTVITSPPSASGEDPEGLLPLSPYSW